MKNSLASCRQNTVLSLMILSLACLLNSESAEASKNAKSPAKSPKVRTSAQLKAQLDGRLSTKMAFSGSKVKGEYQRPAESTARIENEKPLEELLGLRTQFRDRIQAENERQE